MQTIRIISIIILFFISSFSFAQKIYIPSEKEFCNVKINYSQIYLDDAVGTFIFLQTAEYESSEYAGDGYIDKIIIDGDDDGSISVISELYIEGSEVPMITMFNNTKFDRHAITGSPENEPNSLYKLKFAEVSYFKKKEKKTFGFFLVTPNNNGLDFYEKQK
ncbi:MAG: hypothetical protein NTY74_14280 [Ignavibacteriae bacterium]|nr:hypothetical protein [Ignavibacteriota bacterium]